MKAYGEVEMYLHTFLALILGGCKWSVFHHSCFPPGARIPSTHRIRTGWVPELVWMLWTLGTLFHNCDTQEKLWNSIRDWMLNGLTVCNRHHWHFGHCQSSQAKKELQCFVVGRENLLWSVCRCYRWQRIYISEGPITVGSYCPLYTWRWRHPFTKR